MSNISNLWKEFTELQSKTAKQCSCDEGLFSGCFSSVNELGLKDDQ